MTNVSVSQHSITFPPIDLPTPTTLSIQLDQFADASTHPSHPTIRRSAPPTRSYRTLLLDLGILLFCLTTVTLFQTLALTTPTRSPLYSALAGSMLLTSTACLNARGLARNNLRSLGRKDFLPVLLCLGGYAGGTVAAWILFRKGMFKEVDMTFKVAAMIGLIADVGGRWMLEERVLRYERMLGGRRA